MTGNPTTECLELWMSKYYPPAQYQNINSSERPAIPYGADQSEMEQLALCIFGFAFYNQEQNEQMDGRVLTHLTLCNRFPKAKGSRITAAVTYAIECWTEAFGYQ